VNGIPREQIERVARVYRQNGDACAALGITLRSFSRLCSRFDVETPYARLDVETPYARRRRQLATGTGYAGG
jgi:hypothetical protein